MKIVYFNYAAVAILLTMIISAILKKMTKGRANVLFLMSIGMALITSLFSIMAITLDNLVISGKNANHGLMYLAHFGYLFFNSYISFCYVIYIIMLTDRLHKIKKGHLTKIVLSIPILFQFALFIINFFTPVLFYISDAGVYTRGSLFELLYIGPAFYMIYGFVYIIYSRKLFTTRWIITLFAPNTFVLLALFVEYLRPDIVITSIGLSIGYLFIFSNVQRPEEIIDHKTGLNNDYSFHDDSVKAFRNEKEFGIIAVNIMNFSALLDTMSTEGETDFLKELSEAICTILKAHRLSFTGYYIRFGQFRFSVNEPGKSFKEASDEIHEKLTHKNEFSHSNFFHAIYLIQCPDDVNSYEELRMFASSPMADSNRDSYILARDIVRDRNYLIQLEIDRITDYAIKNEKFEIYYQPIYSIEKKKYISAEALLRLNTQDFGFINPEVIVTAAEKSGHILPIGNFVLTKVCQFIHSDAFQDLGLEYIEVNLSVAQCMQENTADMIISTLKKYDVAPSLINLEITETAVVKSGSLLTQNIKKLSDYGIRFSLDDFGSGYSSLDRISKLPVSILKIDKSLTDDFSSPRGAAVLRNAINMSKELEIETVVEGVETEEQFRCFEKWNATFIQGFFFSRPIPLDQFIKFLKDHR